MEIKELIDLCRKFVSELKEIEKRKANAEYNLFNLSSYNNQKENFHTDVISSLLDINGLHEEGDKYIFLFIDYLNLKFGYSIEKINYKDVILLREFGNRESKMDLLIKGDGHCILIENKMNGAPDMVNQLDRYFEIAIGKGEKQLGLEMDAIIYLTLDGIGNAPTPENLKAKELLSSIGAYTDDSINEKDLINGWLNKCIKISEHQDSKSLINQYVKLIKHLNAGCMENNTVTNFYQIANNKSAIETVNAIKMLSGRLPLFRVEKIINEIEDSSPFGRPKRYSTYNSYLYEGFKTFQLRIDCNEDGSIELLYHNLDKHKFNNSTFEILEKSGLIEEFIQSGDNELFTKIFSLNTQYETIQQIDEHVIDFLKIFFFKMKTL